MTGINQKMGVLGISAMLRTNGKTKNWYKKIAQLAEKLTPQPFLQEVSTVIKIAKQQPLEDAEVYNLATRFGMYFANGVLVSNSMDALRYFAVSYAKREPLYKPPVSDISNRDWSLG